MTAKDFGELITAFVPGGVGREIVGDEVFHDSGPRH